jgi:hypothetical protein
METQIMKIVNIVFLMSLSAHTFASSWEGKVQEIEVTVTSPVVLFRLSGELKNSPRCNDKEMYAIDTGLPGGRIAVDILRSAYENDRPVAAQGLNSCAAHFHADGLKTIQFQ